MSMTMLLDIVSAEREIYSGRIQSLIITGGEGELGIHPGHTPLLTSLKPGYVKIAVHSQVETFYVSGGMVEVQPDRVVILADTVTRLDELDEVAAKEAQQKALDMMAGKKAGDIDYQAALIKLEEASAQLRLLKDIHKYTKTKL